MKTSWLVGTEGSVDSQLQKLTFKPDIYSPNWKLIDAEDVRLLQDQKHPGDPLDSQ